MKQIILLLASVFLTVASIHADVPEARPNVLLICVDDLRPELACYGATYIHSPNIDGLAARGRVFRRHYVQAPTCGASRFTLRTSCFITT